MTASVPVSAAASVMPIILPLDRLGTTDDCGFSLFYDDTTTSRDAAFAKIAARIEGTRMAEKALGLS